MRAEVRVVERFCTGDIRDLRVIPAVRAEDWGRDAELAGLLDDLADFFIVSRDEDDIGVSRLELRQRCLEVLVLGEEGFFHEDLAACCLELLLEDLAEALRVIRAVIDVDDSRLSLEVLGSKLRHDRALLRIDEAAAEDERLDLAVLYRDVRARGIRCDDGDLVVRSDLRLSDDVRRDSRADEDGYLIIRDQLRCRIDGL